MNKEKRARLEANGWRYGSAKEFLELTSEDAASVERKLARGNRRVLRRATGSVLREKRLARSKKERNH